MSPSITLLTHTSGLSSELSNQLYREIEGGTSGPVAPPDRARYFGLSSQWSLDTTPSEQYAYNNFGYILLAHIIEEVSGQSYADYLNQTIFPPLKMHNTGYQDSSSGVAKLYYNCDDTTGKILENEDGIGYIDINTFGDQTTPELRAALDEVLAQNPRGLIIDLRTIRVAI